MKVAFLPDVFTELNNAKRKFPKWPKDCIHAAAVVAEESGELVRAALQFTYETDLQRPRQQHEKMKREAIQVAAMALRFLDYVNEVVARPSMELCHTQNSNQQTHGDAT